MDLLCRLMPIAGMGLLLIFVPLLALITFVFAAKSEKGSGVIQSLGYFIGYLLWVGIGFGFLLITPLGNSQWWIGYLMFWLLLGSVPHGILYIQGRRSNNRPKSLAGVFGFMTTASAILAIGLLCYSARFF